MFVSCSLLSRKKHGATADNNRHCSFERRIANVTIPSGQNKIKIELKRLTHKDSWNTAIQQTIDKHIICPRCCRKREPSHPPFHRPTPPGSTNHIRIFIEVEIKIKIQIKTKCLGLKDSWNTRSRHSQRREHHTAELM